jgi:apolipoprotein N-acyltransferase
MEERMAGGLAGGGPEGAKGGGAARAGRVVGTTPSSKTRTHHRGVVGIIGTSLFLLKIIRFQRFHNTVVRFHTGFIPVSSVSHVSWVVLRSGVRGAHVSWVGLRSGVRGAHVSWVGLHSGVRGAHVSWAGLHAGVFGALVVALLCVFCSLLLCVGRRLVFPRKPIM